MMSVVPLFWQGATRKRKLLELLQPRLDAWLLAWNANRELTASMEPVDAIGGAQATEAWHVFGTKAAGVVLRAGRDTDTRLGCALMGLRQSDSQGLATGIGRRAICDLVSTLLQIKADGIQMEALSRPDPIAIDPKHGVAAFDCLIGNTAFRFHFDVATCRSLLPHHAPNEASNLVPRRQAVIPINVQLRAILDLGELTLQEGISLRPGEILKTGLRLDSSVRLETEQGQPVSTGVLKAIDGNRAVQCTVPIGT